MHPIHNSRLGRLLVAVFVLASLAGCRSTAAPCVHPTPDGDYIYPAGRWPADGPIDPEWIGRVMRVTTDCDECGGWIERHEIQR